MDKFVEMVPNWSEELFGFNQGTLGVLIGLVLLGFIARLVAVMTIQTCSMVCARKVLSLKLQSMVQVEHWALQ